MYNHHRDHVFNIEIVSIELVFDFAQHTQWRSSDDSSAATGHHEPLSITNKDTPHRLSFLLPVLLLPLSLSLSLVLSTTPSFPKA